MAFVSPLPPGSPAARHLGGERQPVTPPVSEGHILSQFVLLTFCCFPQSSLLFPQCEEQRQLLPQGPLPGHRGP